MNEWIHQSFKEQMKENQFFMIHTTWRHHAFLLIFWSTYRQALKSKHWIDYHCLHENGGYHCCHEDSPPAGEGSGQGWGLPWDREGKKNRGNGWVGGRTKQPVLRMQVTFSLLTRMSCDLAGNLPDILTFIFSETWRLSSKPLISPWLTGQIPQNQW